MEQEAPTPAEVPEPNARTAQNETSGIPQMKPPEVSQQASIKNNKKNTERSDNDPILHLPDGRTMEKSQQACLEFLKEQWEYVALKGQYSQTQLDGIYALGADILSSSSPTVRVGGQDMPRKQVEQRLLSLDSEHIMYVLDAIGRVTQPIHNMRSYLLTSLYNAPTTIDAYYDALFARNEQRQQPRNNYER